MTARRSPALHFPTSGRGFSFNDFATTAQGRAGRDH
jgi:hypothetical protein